MRSIVFTGMLMLSGTGLLLLRPAGGSEARGEIIVSVPGVPGPYCMYGVEKRLADLPEVADMRLDWAAEEIRILLNPGATTTRERIEEAIERAEYPYEYRIEL